MSQQILKIGDCRALIKELPDSSIDCVVTSPPYFCKRDYKTPPLKWQDGSVCQLGQEPSPQLFVQHLVDIFTSLKPKLKDTGSMWINLGDSYSTATKGDNRKPDEFSGKVGTLKYNSDGENCFGQSRKIETGLPDKCLCLIPERFAIAMIDNGFILRNAVIWHKCLSSDTVMFAKVDGRYWKGTINELSNIQSNNIYLPSVDREGNRLWVKSIKINKVGKARMKKITLTNGIQIKVTPEHRFPVTVGSPYAGKEYNKLTIKSASELKKRHHLWTSSDSFDLDIPEGTEEDYKLGYLIGFFVAEGNFINKTTVLKNTMFSECALARWSKEKGYNSIDEYIENRQDKNSIGIQLACGVKDIERGYIKNFPIQFNYNKNIYGNKLHITSYGKDIVQLIQKYVSGTTCHDYSITNEVFNTNKKFISGILYGFLNGDAHYDIKYNRYRVGITENRLLMNDLMLLSNIVGYEFRYHVYSNTAKIGDKVYSKLQFTIQPKKRFTGCRGIFLQAIRLIEDCDVDDVYDIEIEPIYKLKSNIPSKEKRKSKYNNLYFLGNGVLTHNSNAMPGPWKDRLTNSYEYVYHFVKKPRYFYDLDLIREPLSISSIQRISQPNVMNQKGGFKQDELRGNPTSGNASRCNKMVQSLAMKYNGKFSNISEDCEQFGSPRARTQRKPYAVQERTKEFVEYRENLPTLDELKQYINSYRTSKNLTIDDVEQKFGNMAAHHWFSGECYPSPEDWLKLKEILGLDDEYDEVMTTEYQRPSDKVNHPLGKNPSDAWTTSNSKFLTNDQKTSSPGARSILTQRDGKLTTFVRTKLQDCGQHLKDKLKESGYTTQELADIIGIKETTLSHYFRTDLSGQAIPDQETWIVLQDLIGIGNYKDYVSEEFRSALPQSHPLGKNPSDFWNINTKPYLEAHFATFPEELVRRPILATCPKYICKKCGKIRERLYKSLPPHPETDLEYNSKYKTDDIGLNRQGFARSNSMEREREASRIVAKKLYPDDEEAQQEYINYVHDHGGATRQEFIGYSDCGCGAQYDSGWVLDPFAGSGTVLDFCRQNGYNAIGMELNPSYGKLIEERAMLNVPQIKKLNNVQEI